MKRKGEEKKEKGRKNEKEIYINEYEISLGLVYIFLKVIWCHFVHLRQIFMCTISETNLLLYDGSSSKI